MMRRSALLRFAVVAFGAVTSAVAMVSLAAPCAHAFTMESLSTGGNSTRFADPDERVKDFGQGAHPFGQNGPVVQFGGSAGAAGQGGSYVRPFSGPHGGFYGPPPPLVGGNN